MKQAASIIEEAIVPELPICDPHHHLWDHPNSHYMLEEFLQDTKSGHNIIKSIYVECQSRYKNNVSKEMRPIGETEFVRSIAGKYEKTTVASGIVAYADLRLGADVVPVIEAQIQAGGGLVSGIRNSSAWAANPKIQSYMNPPKGLLFESKFREGFSFLQKYGLSFDAWLYFTQLSELIDLARTFPETRIIIDHLGGPINIGPYAGKRKEVFNIWRNKISLLAKCPNVFIKLGGFGSTRCVVEQPEQIPQFTSTQLAEEMKPYCYECIEQFGANRCMFESNFPVDKVIYSYNVLWNAFKLITKNFSENEQIALFHDTAAKAYKLKK